MEEKLKIKIKYLRIWILILTEEALSTIQILELKKEELPHKKEGLLKDELMFQWLYLVRLLINIHLEPEISSGLTTKPLKSASFINIKRPNLQEVKLSFNFVDEE